MREIRAFRYFWPIWREIGLRVSERTVGRVLEAINARYGMARPSPRPEWTKARKSRHVRRILRVVENLPHGEVAYYQDEVDIHLNPKVGRDWMNARTQKEVATPGKNVKRFLYGALRFPSRLPEVIAVAVVVMTVSLLVVVAAEVGRRMAERRLGAVDG